MCFSFSITYFTNIISGYFIIFRGILYKKVLVISVAIVVYIIKEYYIFISTPFELRFDINKREL